MSGTYQRPPGTKDWWGEDAVRRRWIVEQARGLFEAAGFGEIVTPTFEDTRVFARTSGEESDVVKKEMYTFTDRGDRSLTLRPEGTAGVIRAYIEDGMSRQPQPVKLWYLAPMFRYNRVQRGRFREHYQFGVEVVGSDDPAVDAEVIGLQHRWYRRVGARAVELQLNSIGDAKCRPAYIELLVAFLDEHVDELCDECRERRHTNPLRVLDCKRESCQSVLAQAPKITDHLCEECAAHFAAVRGYLDARGVPYRLDHTLRARARLLHAHRLGVRVRRAGRAGDDRRRRPLRRPGRGAGRPARRRASASDPASSAWPRWRARRRRPTAAGRRSRSSRPRRLRGCTR